MIRRGSSTTSPTVNVLDGTQFQQITRRLMITVRARVIHHGVAENNVVLDQFGVEHLYRLDLESITLSSGILRQQSRLLSRRNTTSDKNMVVQSGAAGLDDDDIIFQGYVDEGNLILTFPGAASDAPVVWDVTAA